MAVQVQQLALETMDSDAWEDGIFQKVADRDGDPWVIKCPSGYDSQFASGQRLPGLENPNHKWRFK